MYMCACECVCMCVCSRTSAYIYIYIYIYPLKEFLREATYPKKDFNWLYILIYQSIYIYIYIYICICICMYLPSPSARAGCDTGLIFKQSLTGFDSDFSFSKNGCLTKAEEPSLPSYWRESKRIHIFPKSISAFGKWNQYLPGFELLSPCPFPTARTITPRAAHLYLCEYVWVPFHTHTRARARTHTHTQTHTYIYIYIYIYKQFYFEQFSIA